jgi:hypothetical protein
MPRAVSGRIRRFIRSLGKLGSPIYLPFTFVSSDYRPQYCLNNCEIESQRTGHPTNLWMGDLGKPVDRFIEAEFHAVISRNGSLVDITPRVDGELRVLFVADPQRVPEHLNERTWKTWSNHKSLNGQIIDATQRLIIINPTV